MVCIGADRKDRRCSRVGRMASSAWMGGTIYRVRGPLTQLEERCPRPQSSAVPRPPCLLLLKGHLLRSPQTPMFSETYKGQSGTGTREQRRPLNRAVIAASWDFHFLHSLSPSGLWGTVVAVDPPSRPERLNSCSPFAHPL